MYKEALIEIDSIVTLKENGVRLVISEKMTEKDCGEFIKKAIPILNAEIDYFTASTSEVLKEFGWDGEKLRAKKKSEPEIPKEIIKKIVEQAEEVVEVSTEETIAEVTDGLMPVSEIVTKVPFSTLFHIDQATQDAITKSMKKGFDKAHPLILWGNVLIDGHTRLMSAVLNNIERVPVEVKGFPSEAEALEYAIHNQRDRRNISEADLLAVISVIDTPMSKTDAGAKGGKSEGKIEPSHKITAKKLNIGESKVTDARTVLGDEEAVTEVKTGKKTIREAAKSVRAKKKKPAQKTTKPLSQIESIVQTLRNHAGEQVPVGIVIEEAYALFTSRGGKVVITILEVTLETVLEVLNAAKLTGVDGSDMITVKKALK